MLQVLRSIASFILSLLMPLILIAVGLGLCALGIWQGWSWLATAGMVVAIVGVLHGVSVYGDAFEN